MKQYLYVLKYQRHGYNRPCYKIGITNNPTNRLYSNEYNLNGFVQKLKYTTAKLDNPHSAGQVELIVTLHHIACYGFQHVRGSLYDHAHQAGKITNGQLDNRFRFHNWIKDAYRLVATTFEKCYNCHETHLSNQCKNKNYFRNSEQERIFLEDGIIGVNSVPSLSNFTKNERYQHFKRIERFNKMLEWTMNEPLLSTNHTYDLRQR